MTAAATSAPPVPTVDRDGPSWLAKRRLTRELRLRDETSARLAELDNMADVLNQAADLISEGWLQHSWFAYLDDNGRTKTVTRIQRERDGRPSGGWCVSGRCNRARLAAACRKCGRKRSSAPWTSPGTHSSRPRPNRTIGRLLQWFAHSMYRTSPGGTTILAEPRLKQRHSFAAAPSPP